MTRVTDTFDGAQEQFRASPNAETAAHFRKIANEYYQGDMIGADTLCAAIAETAPKSPEPKPALRWTGGEWSVTSDPANARDDDPKGWTFRLEAKHQGRTFAENKANARLMTAAPDLASALFGLLAACETKPAGRRESHIALQAGIARAALRKAGAL